MYKEGALITFYAETPVHMGAGQSVSYVDLPVQRERHTGFPVLWSSGIKGVLRDLAYRNWNKDAVEIIFGPEEDSSDFASCISITDANILLYPVRSVRGVFAWITCPLVLKRFKENLEILKITPKNQNLKADDTLNELISKIESLMEKMKKMENFSDDKVLVSQNSSLIIGQNKKSVALEEFVFEVKENDTFGNLAKNLKGILPPNSLTNDLEKHLAIVSDNVFKDFVRYAVEIRTRIRIDQATGTVKTGALFTEELIPSESVFYSLLFVSMPFLGVDGELLELLEEKRKEDKENKEWVKVKEETKRKIEELKNSDNESDKIKGERLEKEFSKIKDKVEDKIKVAYEKNALSSEGVLNNLKNLLDNTILQLGGDETLGRGIMRVKLYPSNGASQGGENEQKNC
ncbi:MAG: type III-B CRISPR module RAMP protein Cmr4 [candidate division WOR-3 bacterium]